ncbi:UXT [Bugula neritina]|uniref:UXT n=1 Tax=Bugula neritina TaxID=10212 RepID=A0A7J7KDP5_BUGNE|nr:UXT [Bugula neritina]
MEGKIRKFEEFVNERLRKDLEKVMISRDRVAQQIAQYLQLKTVIEMIQSKGVDREPLRTQYTLPEAILHIDKRMDSLNAAADQLTVEAARIKAHIKTVLEGLREMQDIPAEDPIPHRPVW